MDMKFLKLAILLSITGLCLTGCCRFPGRVLINETVTAEKIENESIVFKNKICDNSDCSESRIEPGNVEIQSDGRKRLIDVTMGFDGRCLVREDDNEVVWFQAGVPSKSLKLICDTTDDTRYHAYLYDAFGGVKELNVAQLGRGWEVNLDDGAPMPMRNEDLMLVGTLPDGISLEKLQIVAYEKNDSARNMVYHKVEIEAGCSVCGDQYRKHRYTVQLDISTGVNEVLWVYEGAIFKSVSLKYLMRNGQVAIVQATQGDGKELYVVRQDEYKRWRVNCD